MYLLLAAVLAAGFGVAWWLITGSTHLPVLAVIGLALAAGAIPGLVESAVHQARVRRTRTRRRAHARTAPAKTRREA